MEDKQILEQSEEVLHNLINTPLTQDVFDATASLIDDVITEMRNRLGIVIEEKQTAKVIQLIPRGV